MRTVHSPAGRQYQKLQTAAFSATVVHVDSRVGEVVLDQFAENEGTKNTDEHSPKRRHFTSLGSPNRHFIETGDSDPHAHDDESFASDHPSSTQQSKEKSVHLPKRAFGTRLKHTV